MAPWGRQRKRRSVTASAARVTRVTSEHTRRLRLPRQLRALEYYDSLGEIWYAAQFYARALSRLDLYVGIRPVGADPNQEPEKITSGTAVDLLNQIQDPGGGRGNLLGTYGRLRFLVGEAYLVYTAPVSGDVDGDEVVVQPGRWEMLSLDEIRIIAGGGFQRMRAPGLPLEELREPPDGDDSWEELPPGTAVVYRLWKRHPRYSDLADAPMFAVLDVCEELLLLTLAVRARAVNRAAGPGLLYVPEEISFSPDSPEGDEDPEEDTFLVDLIEALTTPLKTPGDPSAVVPLIVRGPAQYADSLKQINFRMEGSYPEANLRSECIERIATGLDFPKEALMGMADLNHWNAWQVDEDTWKAHLEPVAMDLCQDLTAAYLHPALMAIQNSGQQITTNRAQTVTADATDAPVAPLEQAQETLDGQHELVIWYDATRVINHPDKSANAQQLHDRAALNDEALRRENGFDETDAPSQAEIARRIGILTRDSGLAITGVPTLKQGAEPEQGLDPAPGDDAPEVTPHPGPADSSPPSAGGEPPSGRAALILGASELAVETARARAGARLRQALKRTGCEDCVQKIDGVPNRQVAAVLATLRVTDPRALPAMSAAELVAGSMEPLYTQLLRWGLGDPEARAICEAAERHAAATLFDSRPVTLSPDVLRTVPK